MTAADMPLPEPMSDYPEPGQHTFTATQMRTHREEYAAAKVAEAFARLISDAENLPLNAHKRKAVRDWIAAYKESTK